jgi:hypothetical protein
MESLRNLASALIEQIEMSDFQDHGGFLKNNVAYLELKTRLNTQFDDWLKQHPDYYDLSGYEKSLMKEAYQAAKADAVPEGCVSIAAHQIIINEVKTEINDSYALCQDSYLLDVLVHRGIQIGKAQAVPDGYVVVPKEPNEKMTINGKVE